MKNLEHYLRAWNLTSQIPIATTRSSKIFKVHFNDRDAILKLLSPTGAADEKNGADALKYFNGLGAVEIFASDDSAHLIEWVEGECLAALAQPENFPATTKILCSVLINLHKSRSTPISTAFVSLEKRFQSLMTVAEKRSDSGEFKAAAMLARELLHSQAQVVVLHGDIHHENILCSPTRGWLAIDPKGILGERTYDTANAFYNPAMPPEILAAPNRILGSAKIFAEQLCLDPMRVLKFAYVHGFLRAAWMIEDNLNADTSLRIARRIGSLLG